MNGNTTKIASLGLVVMMILSVFSGSVAAHETGEQTTYHEDIPTINSSETDVTTVTLSDSETLTGVDVNITSIDGVGNVTIDIVRSYDGDTITSATVSSAQFAEYRFNDSALSGDTYEVRLSTDDADTTAEVSYVGVHYESQNYAPVADAGEDQTVSDGDSVTLDASGSFDRDEGDTDTLTYNWDFGDGETLSGEPTATHTYSEAGTYNVTLTVEDEHGASDTDTVTITVDEQTTDDGSDNDTTEEPATYDVDFGVVDNDTAVENASIVVTDADGNEVANLTTDANGSAVASLEDGTYSYTISADGYEEVSGEVVVDGAAESVSVDFANDDSEAGGTPLPGSGVSYAVIAILILLAGAVAIGGDDR